MLPRGAKHPGGIAVPAIRVGAGGHRPRRTSQLAPIRSAKHARGTARSAVEGASDSPTRFRRKRIVAARAPTSTLCAAPPPFARGRIRRVTCKSSSPARMALSPAALPRMAVRGRAFLSEHADDNRSRYNKGGLAQRADACYAPRFINSVSEQITKRFMLFATMGQVSTAWRRQRRRPRRARILTPGSAGKLCRMGGGARYCMV